MGFDHKAKSRELDALLWVPKSTPTLPGRAILMVPMFNGEAKDWAPLSDAFSKKGQLVLALTLRQKGKTGDIMAYIEDIQSGVHFLRTRHSDVAGSVAIVAAGVGANGALRYASTSPQMENILSALVLMNPGTELNGIGALDAVKKISRIPIQIVVPRKEKFFAQSAEVIKKNCSGPCNTEWVEESAQGTDLFKTKNGSEVLQRIVNFVLR